MLTEPVLISQTAEYALRAIVHLAYHAGDPQTNRQIADATRVSAGYLSKVLQSLGRAELVVAQRGIGGGFVLSRSPEKITVLDVVNAVAPLERIRHCPLGLPSHTSLCPLHKELDKAYAATEEAFARVNIGQVLRSESKIIPLCDV